MAPRTQSAASIAAIRQTLELLAENESIAWVEFLCTRLESEGRLVEGGWPGTISEARRRLMTRVAEHPENVPQDRAEIDRLVDIIYSQAKRRWLQVSRR